MGFSSRMRNNVFFALFFPFFPLHVLHLGIDLHVELRSILVACDFSRARRRQWPKSIWALNLDLSLNSASAHVLNLVPVHAVPGTARSSTASNTTSTKLGGTWVPGMARHPSKFRSREGNLLSFCVCGPFFCNRYSKSRKFRGGSETALIFGGLQAIPKWEVLPGLPRLKCRLGSGHIF